MGDLEAQMYNFNDQRTSSSSSIFNKLDHRPIPLKFEDVVYSVTISQDNGYTKNKKKFEDKKILEGVSWKVLPGEILAILGPSGSGKTTLLKALGGRLGGNLAGAITYNDKPFSNAMKRSTGFVAQDDILYPHLTVTETLVFTALLRLPNSFTKQEKIAHAEAVLTRLGLTRCKNIIIGNHFLRGVSGGERKRVSIGQEMILNPSLLFLDEPTSGLDSTTAQRIVSTLWELACGGRTVVMTIHQPSSRLFYMFHKVLLLSEGNPLYFGKGTEAMDYFASIGYAPSVTMNPSDFLLDLANGIVSDDFLEDQATTKQKLVSFYKAILDEKVKAEFKEMDCQAQDEAGEKHYGEWSTTWWQQFSVLLTRGLKERRHDSFSGLNIFQVLILAVFCGFLWLHSDVSHLQDQAGLLFFYAEFWGFYPLFNSIFTFPQERMMLEKERSSGMYKLSSYFISRIVGDLPMELALPSIFMIIIYWMAGLRPTAGAFFYNLFSLLLSVLVSQGLGLALGALVMDLKSAATLGTVLMLSFSLAGGYFVQHVPPFVSWVKYLSATQYTYKLLLGSQYEHGQRYECGAGMRCLVEDYPAIKNVGLDGQFVSAVVLVLMLVGYRMIAYLALMRIGKIKN